ncbi:hypothetical protein GOBAR_DD31512 [Gossypium barbadense]|nr:hypothetical protein GOBAR_DD31512 [Gossypium barbadense]
MAVDLVPDPPLSSKERLVGKGPICSMRENRITAVEVEDNFDFVEGDITRSMVTSIPSIDFSERVLLFLLQEMGTTVVIKILGLNIGYGESLMVDTVMVDDDRAEETCAYRPWILVERKPRRNARDSRNNLADDDRAGVLGNDDSTSKGQITGGKVSAGRNGRKLNKTKRDRESHFKMSSSSRVSLSKSINNMVEHISSQIGKKGDKEELKVVEKQLEVKDVI